MLVLFVFSMACMTLDFASVKQLKKFLMASGPTVHIYQYIELQLRKTRREE
jgi:hypothetical protein